MAFPSLTGLAQPATSASGVASATLVGVVLPSDARPGEPASATIVTNPKSFANVPGLTVPQATVPLGKDASGVATLEGVVVDTGDGRRQPATGPLLLRSLAPGVPLLLTFFRTGDSTPLARQSLTLPEPANPPAATASPGAAVPKPSDYASSPVIVEDGVNAIHGPIGGDSQNTRVLIDGIPAHILAENPRHVYWQLSPGISPGAHRLALEEGGRAMASFSTAVIGLRLTADSLTLLKGQTTNFRIMVVGGSSIPSGAWQSGMDRTLVSAESLAGGRGQVKPPVEGQPGALMLHIENASGDAVSMGGESHGAIDLLLKRDAFPSDTYAYNGKLTARRAGGFRINAKLTPFLKQQAGAEPVNREGPPASEAPHTQEKPVDTPTTREKPTGSNPGGGSNPPPVEPGDVPIPGKPDIYGHDPIAACPERSREHSTACLALVIDFSKNVFYEFDVEKIGSYLGSSHMCDTTYIAPATVEVPKPWKLGIGSASYTVQPDPKDVQAAQSHNAAEWAKINAAIAEHRQKLAKGGWEFAIEIVNGHGSPKYNFDNLNCGAMGSAFNDGGDIYRAEFNQGNYNAARQNVCTWLSADFTCYGGLTPKVVDELNNLGTSTCRQPSQQHWPRHAGWDGDGGMSAATDDEPTSNGNVLLERQYIQSAVVDAFDTWARAWNTDIWADVDRQALGKKILMNFNSGTGHYTDGGLIKDKALGCHHTKAGYAIK